MTVRRSIGLADTYPGGPRALVRELCLSYGGGQLSYADVEDAAVRAFHVRRGRPRLVVRPTMPVLPVQESRRRPATRSASVTKAPALDPPQKGADA